MDSHSPIIEQGYVVVSEGIISAIGEGTPPKKLNTSLQTIDCAGIKYHLHKQIGNNLKLQ